MLLGEVTLSEFSSLSIFVFLLDGGQNLGERETKEGGVFVLFWLIVRR